MNDLEIKELEQRIIAELNEANCPMEVKRLVLAEIYDGVVGATRSVVESQLKARQENAEKKEEKEPIVETE